MKIWQKIGLLILVAGALGYAAKVKLSHNAEVEPSSVIPKTTNVGELKTQVEPEKNPKILKSHVNIYLIGQNDNNEDVYTIVKRAYSSKNNADKFKYAVSELFKGPSHKEKSKGLYSEIPTNVKLLSVKEENNKIVINLSEAFEQGGGTDSLYKRLYQLIKTVNKNTTKKVYLNIEGKPVEVFGGEGIMLNQPLTESSLGE